jgi:sugar transferase (PEP-CTERM system associated)
MNNDPELGKTLSTARHISSRRGREPGSGIKQSRSHRRVATVTRVRASSARVLQALLEGLIFFLAVVGTIKLNRVQYTVPGPDITLAALVFALLMVSFSSALGLYRRDRSLAFATCFSRVVFALAMVSVAAHLGFQVLGYDALLKDAVGGIALFALGGVVIARHSLEPMIRRTLLRHRVLVLGTGEDALRVDQMNDGGAEPRFAIVGFFPLGSIEQSLVPASRVLSAGSLRQAVERTEADEVIVAVREQRGGMLPIEELLECRLSGVRVTALATFSERVCGRIPVDSLKASWLVYGDGFRQSWRRKAVKRASDCVACVILSVIALPVMLLTALAIFLESGGPIFYRQERVGAGGRTFMMLKFRSMVQDAEGDGVARWAAANDPRVSRVGRLIRGARIDELPQIINVLKGEMSLVGPRPERPHFVRTLEENVPFYAVRHAVKPGITGWAQIRWNYSASIDDSVQKLEFDLFYVKNHTLMMDTRILLETVAVVLSGRSAR